MARLLGMQRARSETVTYRGTSLRPAELAWIRELGDVQRVGGSRPPKLVGQVGTTSRQARGNLVGQHEKLNRGTVHIKTFMLEFVHARLSANTTAWLRTFFGLGLETGR